MPPIPASRGGREKPQRQERQRRLDIKAAGFDDAMPPLLGGQYLLDYLFEIGPVKGEGPIEMRDLLDWQETLGVEWKPWQSRLLIRLSRAYLGEMHRATKRDAEPPWDGAAPMWRRVQRKADDRRLDAFL